MTCRTSVFKSMIQVFGLYYCVGMTFSTIQVLDFLFSDPEGQVQ